MSVRQFEDRPAIRERVPLLVGLMGPSGGGKTYSALRLATGIQKISGGEIYCLDTEARRSLHYADKFAFKHVQFDAPFSPSDYLSALDHCVKKGAGTIIVDSMSHEHEGPGGLLEMHESEVERLARGDAAKAERVKMLAWAKPKAERRRLINSILQMNRNFIFCFRAKEKIKMQTGKDPIELGFMPIAGEEFLYEMTVNCLLLPSANGVPTWQTQFVGERLMIKLPEQFKELFAESKSLDETIGERLAAWAAGGAKPEILAKPPETPKAQPAVKSDRQSDHPATNGDLISEAQRKRFYAMAKGASRSDEQIKEILGKIGLTSTKDIPKSIYNPLCAWAEGALLGSELLKQLRIEDGV